MFVDIGTARLFVDVEGVGLDASGKVLRQKPTLLLLHGGPASDHTMFKPLFSTLSDVAQIVYFDMRGCGRSSGRDPKEWNLAQWAEDVKSLSDALGIVQPIVLGLSFGGFVAQAYATRYPRHPGGLVLISTAARMPAGTVFDALVDVQTGEADEIGKRAWESGVERTEIWRGKLDPAARVQALADFHRHAVLKPKVAEHFFKAEQGSFDFRAALKKVKCPTLVLAGDADPTIPLPLAEELAGRIPAGLVQLEVFHKAGHCVQLDAPTRVMAAIREFVTA